MWKIANKIHIHLSRSLYLNLATFTTRLRNVHAAFGSAVTLQCEVSDSKTDCKWLRNGIELKTGQAGVDGYERSLRFRSISHDDEGEYECRSGNQSSKATVNVRGMNAICLLTFEISAVLHQQQTQVSCSNHLWFCIAPHKTRTI